MRTKNIDRLTYMTPDTQMCTCYINPSAQLSDYKQVP